MVVMTAQHLQESADPATTSTRSARTRGRVQFHGVEVREYARSLAQNPAAEDGPPLGLDWEFRQVTVESKNPARKEPVTIIPIDDYEKETERKRRAKLMQMCKLRAESMKHILSMHNMRMKSSRKKKHVDQDDSERTLSEEQMRQLSAHWLKIQPLTGREREKIILQQTDCTKEDLENNEKVMRKLKNQRKHTAASAETGIDDWHAVIEFFKRRYRRFKTGITKQREQELLWEQAPEYWKNGGSVSTSARSLRSSLSSVHHDDAVKAE